MARILPVRANRSAVLPDPAGTDDHQRAPGADLQVERSEDRLVRGCLQALDVDRGTVTGCPRRTAHASALVVAVGCVQASRRASASTRVSSSASRPSPSAGALSTPVAADHSRRASSSTEPVASRPDASSTSSSSEAKPPEDPRPGLPIPLSHRLILEHTCVDAIVHDEPCLVRGQRFEDRADRLHQQAAVVPGPIVQDSSRCFGRAHEEAVHALLMEREEHGVEAVEVRVERAARVPGATTEVSDRHVRHARPMDDLVHGGEHPTTGLRPFPGCV